jgi:ATP-dependent HslUV protease ATP-binding subunit HslU
VQRDLLPLIEGTVVSTKHGNVNTDFILFIASGAFHSSKPSDLLAELQGRLPIKVSLKGLTEEDFYRILTEPVTNLIRQQVEMIKTENVTLSFSDAGIREVAKVAFEMNKSIENIGARRLHAIIEKVVEEVSFEAPEQPDGHSVLIDEGIVKERVGDMMKSLDLRKYIL